MKFLLLNQTFYPDVMATGQYLAEVAVQLVERGHEVTVVTSRRAYDHPDTQFQKREAWRGVRIIRVGSTGLGKGAKWRRAADFASFVAQCSLRVAGLPKPDVVVALTSPPLISFLGAWLAKLRGSRFVYWVMDFNPDEAIAAGWLRPGSFPARALERMSRFSLKRATRIIALDRFMRDRILSKGVAPEKVAVFPPWSQGDEVQFDPGGRERFRQRHGLGGKFVVMYSGNHSPCHPLDTLMAAAERLEQDESVVFCFVGGGSEFKRVKRWAEQGRHNHVICLPYQPLNELAGSLSAADLHVVVMGDPFVGLVHPCKIYNILGVGAPVLYIGPRLSHITEIAEAFPGAVDCVSVCHGDVDRAVEQIRQARNESGRRARPLSPSGHTLYSKETVLPKLIAELLKS